MINAWLIDPHAQSPFWGYMTVEGNLGLFCDGIVGEGIRLVERPEHKYWRMHGTKYLHALPISSTHYQLSGVLHWSNDKDYWDYSFSYDRRLMLSPFEIDYYLDADEHWVRSVVRFGDTLADGQIRYDCPRRRDDFTRTVKRLWESRTVHLEYWAIVTEIIWEEDTTASRDQD